ncbi:membrane protein [Gordonia phage Kabocha]|nr:membrane protein [Gordonia phage Gray]WAA19848.1 membrane protein [Gordonia phage Kabocha]WAA20038.1 membrane protein [Gordonia phage Hanem]WNM67081.1 membrane protein [Gordonia Phage Schomber]
MSNPYASTQAVSNDANLQPPATFTNYVPPIPGVTPGPADLQLALAAYAQRKLAEQKWYQKSKNTVVTAVGGAATLAGSYVTYLLASGTDVPQWVTLIVGLIGFIGTVVGVKNSKNGFTFQGAAQLQQAVLDPVVLTTVQRVMAQEPFPAHIAEGAEAAIERAAKEARQWVEETQNGSQG